MCDTWSGEFWTGICHWLPVLRSYLISHSLVLVAQNPSGHLGEIGWVVPSISYLQWSGYGLGHKQGANNFWKKCILRTHLENDSITWPLRCQALERWESCSVKASSRTRPAWDSAHRHVRGVGAQQWCKAQRSEGDLAPCSRRGPSSSPSSAWLSSTQKNQAGKCSLSTRVPSAITQKLKAVANSPPPHIA